MKNKLTDIRLIVFDLDGTLIDSFTDITNAINHVREQQSLSPMPIATVKGFVGDGIRKLVMRAFQFEGSGNGDRLETTIMQVRQYYHAHAVEHTAPYAGVEETLQRLKEKRFTLAVLSNKPDDLSNHIVRTLGLTRWIDEVRGASDAFPIKPAPDALTDLIERNGSTPECTLMVGDGRADIEVARNGGVHFCGVTYGILNADQLIERGVERYIDRITDLGDLLNSASQAG